MAGPPDKARIVLQMEAAECGAACLTMILSAYGREIQLEEAREKCGTSRDGVDAAALSRAAVSYGMQVKAIRCEPETLADIPLPAILHWNFNHFVVLEAVTRNHFVLLDPACGRRAVTRAEMGRGLTGLVLAMVPGNDFEEGGTRPRVLPALLRQTRGSLDALGLVFLLGIAGIIPGLVLSGAVQTFANHVVGQDHAHWLGFVLAALSGAVMLQVAIGALREWVVTSLKAKIGIAVATKAFKYSLFLPMGFFAQRNVGEVVSRLRIGSEIGGTVAGPLAQLLPNLVAAFAYLAIIFLYDPLLGGMVAAIAAINLWVLVTLSRRLSDANRLQNVLEGTASGVATTGFMAFAAFRLLGREDLFSRRWMGAEEAALDAEQRLGTLRALVTLGPAASSLLITICVLVAGAFRVMHGDLDLGALLAMQVLAGLVSAPISAIATQYCALQEAAGALMRLDDLVNHPADKLVNIAGPAIGVSVPEVCNEAERSADLKLTDVHLGFGVNPDLLRNVSLVFPSGELTAIVGPSGSGKSSLAKIAAGMLPVRSGTVTFAGREIAAWPHESLRKRLLYVPQASSVISGTIRENITMWDSDISDDEIDAALELAGLRDVVDRAGGLLAAISAQNAGLSGGEIQRLALARALARRPDVLVLDEVTSALDAISEQKVLDGLRQSGAAVILVTHRRGSEARCDRTVELDGRGGFSVTRSGNETTDSHACTPGEFRKAVA